METPIAMVLLSRVLKHKANRWANIIVAAINMAAVVAGEQVRPYYVLFATVEVVSMAAVVWLAWKWSNPESYAQS